MGKNVTCILKQSGKALCYYALFLGVQLIVSILFALLMVMQPLLQAAANGSPMPSEQDLYLMLMDALNRHSGLLVILCGLPVILILWLFFLIRRRKFHLEAQILPFRISLLPWIVLLALGITGFLNTFLNLLPESWLEKYGEASSSLTGGPFWILLIATGICAPVVEEIIFRGLILSRLKKAMPFWAAAVISSLLFGIAHGQILWTAYTFCIGLLFCVIAQRTKSILSTILAHSVFNASSTCLAFLEFRFTPLTFWSMMTVGAVFLIVGTGFIIRSQEADSAVSAKAPEISAENDREEDIL